MPRDLGQRTQELSNDTKERERLLEAEIAQKQRTNVMRMHADEQQEEEGEEERKEEV